MMCHPVPHRLQPPRFRHPHRADGQHGAGGSTGVRVNHPRQGMPVCSGYPCAGSNPRRGFIFNGLPKHCRARCATPHGVVGAAASPTATDREPLTGFGALSGTSLSTTSPSVACSVRNRRHAPPCPTPPPPATPPAPASG